MSQLTGLQPAWLRKSSKSGIVMSENAYTILQISQWFLSGVALIGSIALLIIEKEVPTWLIALDTLMIGYFFGTQQGQAQTLNNLKEIVTRHIADSVQS